MTGLALLGLASSASTADPCDDLPSRSRHPRRSGLAAAAGRTGRRPGDDRPARRCWPALVPQLTGALGGKAAWPDRFAAARGLITRAQRDLPALAHRRRRAQLRRTCDRRRLLGAALDSRP